MRTPWVPLREVLRQVADPVPVNPEATYRSAGILNRGRGLFDKGELAGSETTYKTLYRLHQGQIVYSKLFGWEGAIARVPPEFDGFLVSSEFPMFAVDAELASPQFVEQALKAEHVADQMVTSASGLGQRRQRVNVDAFLRVRIPLPPRAEQERIVDHLSGAERILSPRGERDVVRELRDAWWWRLSERWPLRGLAELLTPRSPEVLVADREYPLGGVFGFGRGVIQRPSITSQETKYRTLTRAGAHDFVYSKLKAFEGAVAVVGPQDAGRYFSQEFPVFATDQAVLRPGYLEQVVLGTPFLQMVAACSSGLGARRERVHPQRLLALSIPVPPANVQDRVAAITRLAVRAERLSARAGVLRAATLLATRNEIFNAM